MTTLREAAKLALGTLQDVCARLLYRGVSKDPDHPDQIALEQARQTIRALKQATEQFEQERDPVAWDGWIVREVLFDEGEPVGHREHKPLSDEKDLRRAWNEYPIDTSEKRGPMLMTVGDTLERAGFMKRPQPLTDEQLVEAYCCVNDKEWAIGGMTDARIFARAIERAHGIGGKE
jgi:hypothetical protein